MAPRAGPRPDGGQGTTRGAAALAGKRSRSGESELLLFLGNWNLAETPWYQRLPPFGVTCGKLFRPWNLAETPWYQRPPAFAGGCGNLFRSLSPINGASWSNGTAGRPAKQQAKTTRHTVPNQIQTQRSAATATPLTASQMKSNATPWRMIQPSAATATPLTASPV